MLSAYNQTQLQQLRPGDRLSYHGVPWQVKDYSTYTDPVGYEITEWLLSPATGTDYYLLREVDPNNPKSLENWYLAEEIYKPKIFQPNLFNNLVGSLWQDMHDHKIPYPELQALSRQYYFESQTEGTYSGKSGETARITWDYWDKPRQWNLAIEAWANGELHIYSTKVVNPEEFSAIQKGQEKPVQSFLKIVEFIGACCLVVWGLFMLIFG